MGLLPTGFEMGALASHGGDATVQRLDWIPTHRNVAFPRDVSFRSRSIKAGSGAARRLTKPQSLRSNRHR